jgi:hypothetical protein
MTVAEGTRPDPTSRWYTVGVADRDQLDARLQAGRVLSAREPPPDWQ